MDDVGHYAQIDEENIVVQVIRARNIDIELRMAQYPERWVKCSYNTRGGVHSEGGTPLRKNYPGMNWSYDAIRDAFIPPKKYDSWVLNEDTCLWQPPVPLPQDASEKLYIWDEELKNWIEDTSA